MKAVLTFAAKADIAEAAAWYRGRSIQAAENFLGAVTLGLDRLEANPTRYPVVDPDTGARRAILRKFPQRMYYLIEESRLVVVAVTHVRRDSSVWRKRLS